MQGTDFAVEDMQFIDFEYAAWCYQWYDIGNHFDEYAGFEGDYSRFPDEEAAKRFVRSYLQQGQHEPVSPLKSQSWKCHTILYHCDAH